MSASGIGFYLRIQLNDALIESCILNIANCTFQDVFERYDERGALVYMDTLNYGMKSSYIDHGV